MKVGNDYVDPSELTATSLERIADALDDYLRITLSAQRMMVVSRAQDELPWPLRDAMNDIANVMQGIMERRGW